MYYKTKIERELDEEFGSMSLSKFLSRYVNVRGSALNKVTHSDVRILFPDLQTMPLTEIKHSSKPDEDNTKLVYSGDIVLVTDGREIVAYVAPELKCVEEDEMNFYGKKAEQKINNDIGNCADLNEYELRLLLRRKFNSLTVQSAARRELRSRGVAITKKYKRNNKKIFYEEE